MKTAPITKVTDQDGARLAKLPPHKGYEVHGITRRAGLINTYLRWLCPTADPLPLAMLETLETVGDLAVSAVSCWEVAYLAKRGRLVLPPPLSTWLQAALAGSEISCVPLTGLIAASAANLADLHRDPADRFIIATALSTQRRLLTLDSTISSYPELADLLA